MYIYQELTNQFAISLTEKSIMGAQTELVYKFLEDGEIETVSNGPFWPQDADFTKQIKRK